jgi:hypothetical protein
MYCNYCGLQNPDNGRYCNNCGQPLGPASAGSPAPPPRTDTESVVPPPPLASSPVPTPPGTIPTNDGKAVASLILGILSLTFFWIFAGIPAIVLGHLSRSQIKKSMGRLKGEGMALAGLIMGYLSVAILPFVLIIAAIAIPNLLRARIAANEASSVGSLRTINVANVTYAATYGSGLAPSLSALGGGTNCQPTKEHACLIDSVLSNGQKSGYRFTYTAEDSDSDGVIDKYFLEAEPISKGASGQSTYCSDESGVIRRQRNGRCTPESPSISDNRNDD